MFRNRSHFGSRVAQAVCDLLILVIKLSMSEAWVELLRFSVATTFVSLGVLGTCWGGAGTGAVNFVGGSFFTGMALALGWIWRKGPYLPWVSHCR